MDTRRLLFLFSFLLASTLPLIAAPSWAADPAVSDPSSYFPGQVLVRIQAGTSAEQVRKIAETAGAEVARRLTSWGAYLFTFDESTPVEEVIRKLQSDPVVEYAEPNARITAFKQPQAEDLFSGIVTQSSGTPVIVAVIDTGVDLTHPGLSGKLYVNPGEIAGDGIDNDGNGYVDDVNGYDFYSRDADPTGGPGDGAHGTMVSGRVLQGALDTPIALMALRVGPGPSLSLAAIIEAIDYAANNGARVINMSFGTTANFLALQDAINYAASRDVFLVAAAGNSGTEQKNYPGAYSAVNAVAASDATGRKTSWSSYGKWVDFTAPGDRVTTLTWGGGTAVVSGTSFSSPFVAGVAARIRAALSTLSASQVKTKLASFAKDVYAVNSRTLRGKLGLGFVDEVVAQRVADAYPLTTSLQLIEANRQVTLLESGIAQAQQSLNASGGKAAQAKQRVGESEKALRQARREFTESWQALQRAGATASETARLQQRAEEASGKLQQAAANLAEALARLRVAQAEETQARDRRDGLAGQLKSARLRVDQLTLRLAQTSVGSQEGASAQQLETQALLRQLQLLHDVLQAPLPEGLNVSEVPEMDLPTASPDKNRT